MLSYIFNVFYNFKIKIKVIKRINDDDDDDDERTYTRKCFTMHQKKERSGM